MPAPGGDDTGGQRHDATEPGDATEVRTDADDASDPALQFRGAGRGEGQQTTLGVSDEVDGAGVRNDVRELLADLGEVTAQRHGAVMAVGDGENGMAGVLQRGGDAGEVAAGADRTVDQDDRPGRRVVGAGIGTPVAGLGPGVIGQEIEQSAQKWNVHSNYGATLTLGGGQVPGRGRRRRRCGVRG